MTTLVTGGTGFVGAAVIRQLLARGESVRALARANSDRRNLDGLDLEIAEGDLRDLESLRRAMKSCDAVYHVAADYRLWTRNPEALYSSNVGGTSNLMQAALEATVTRVVYTSSVATLGINPDGRPANEESPVSIDDMIGDYKRSKFLAEQVVREFAQKQSLPVVIVNPSTPIGPGDIKPTPTGRIILDALNGRMPAYVDTGLNLVHVDDVAQGHLLAFEHGKPGERYVLGGHDLSLREILEKIAELSGGKPPRFRLPHSVVLPIAYLSEWWAWLTNGEEPRATVAGVRMSRKQMFFSSAKAERELGYRYRDVDEALQDAIDWFT